MDDHGYKLLKQKLTKQIPKLMFKIISCIDHLNEHKLVFFLVLCDTKHLESRDIMDQERDIFLGTLM